MALLDEILFEDQEMRPWVFLLVGNENNQGDIIIHTTLYEAASGESAYEKISLTMQTAIQVLQKVDLLAKRRQTAIIKSNKIFAALPNTIKVHLGVGNLK